MAAFGDCSALQYVLRLVFLYLFLSVPRRCRARTAPVKGRGFGTAECDEKSVDPDVHEMQRLQRFPNARE